MSRYPNFQTMTTADELSDSNLTPLPTHPGLRYVARSPCCDYMLFSVTWNFSIGMNMSYWMKKKHTGDTSCLKKRSTNIVLTKHADPVDCRFVFVIYGRLLQAICYHCFQSLVAGISMIWDTIQNSRKGSSRRIRSLCAMEGVKLGSETEGVTDGALGYVVAEELKGWNLKWVRKIAVSVFAPSRLLLNACVRMQVICKHAKQVFPQSANISTGLDAKAAYRPLEGSMSFCVVEFLSFPERIPWEK